LALCAAESVIAFIYLTARMGTFFVLRNV